MTFRVDRSCFDGVKSISGANGRTEVFAKIRLRATGQLLECTANQFLGLFAAQQPSHRVITFREVAISKDALDLFVFWKIRGDRFFKLDAPHGFRILRYENVVALLAFTEIGVRLLSADFRGDSRSER